MQFLPWDQSPYLLIFSLVKLLGDHMPNLFAILWKLEKDLPSLLLDFKLIVNIVFSSNEKRIMAWEDLKLTIFTKYFLVVPAWFDLLI